MFGDPSIKWLFIEGSPKQTSIRPGQEQTCKAFPDIGLYHLFLKDLFNLLNPFGINGFSPAAEKKIGPEALSACAS